jgi:predicted O-methyltransferase YrrM
LPERPPLVERAQALARAVGFEDSCSDETGRLLHVLAGMRGRFRVAEIGTGAGVGAAWMVSALDPAVPFFTAERDAGLAAAAAELFREDPNVHVLPGDWRELLPREAPFDLVFLDAADLDGEEALGVLSPRGLVISGLQRGFWLGHPDLQAAEVSVSAREALILAVRSR